MAPEAPVTIPPSPSFVQTIYLPSGDQEMKIFPFPSNGVFHMVAPVLASHITRSLRSTEMISLPSGDQPSAPAVARTRATSGRVGALIALPIEPPPTITHEHPPAR